MNFLELICTFLLIILPAFDAPSARLLGSSVIAALVPFLQQDLSDEVVSTILVMQL